MPDETREALPDLLDTRDPCDGCDGECGDVCPVFEARRAAVERGALVGAEREIDRLRAENETMKKALLQIATANMPYRSFTNMARHVARLALQSDENDAPKET